MRSANTLHAILDDAAALGDSDRLHAIRVRWERRAVRRELPAGVALVWLHASDAAYWRARAIDMRLAGSIDSAMRLEREADRCVGLAENYGTR